MNASKSIFRTGLFAASLFFFTSCEKIPTTVDDPNLQDANALANRKGSGGGGGESVGNNLSFPVIWAEGPTQTLTLRVPPAGSTTESVVKAGAWWFVWGADPIDPSSPIFSCQPTPAGELTCIDGTQPGDNSSTVYKAYLQKDIGNYWQASAFPATAPVNVDWIDWGDNLESIDWSLSSKVRTEVVLTEDLPTAVTQYAMRHVSGWGIDEVHGLQTDRGNGTVQKGTGLQATVYSRHARLTIQRLYETPVTLTWNQSSHIWTGDAYAPVFNKAVWQAADGPGYYNAEVNVKGKVIFGYTWDVNKLNSGAGVYRITFSFDGAEETQAGSPLNTFFDGTSKIVVPVEEVTAEAEEDGGGGTPVIDAANNLTFIDVTISGRGKGGGKR